MLEANGVAGRLFAALRIEGSAGVWSLGAVMTLLGSVANLIVAESAGARGVLLGFGEYTRAGVVITALSLALGGVWLQFVSW